MGVDEIYITGGEPFLFSGFNNLLALLIRKKIFLAGIYTNGVLMCSNRHIIEKIAKEYRTTFYISLDGLNDGHLKLRGLDKSFQETIHAIEFLNDLGIAIVINTVISELQASSAIELYSLLVKYKILRWRVDVPFPMGSAITHWSELQLSPERELLIYQQILEMWLLDNMPFDLELGHYFRYINGHIRTIEYSQNSFVCGYNRDSIVIWPAGEVTACSRVVPDSSWGNVKETKLNTIWESQYIRAMKDKRVRDFPKCRSCDHYKYCGGGCPAENNMDLASNLDEPSSVCNLFRGGYFKEFSQMLNRLQKKHCVNLFTQP
jgi:radical SAM protein with 4Fe4S-binding SPASM domain